MGGDDLKGWYRRGDQHPPHFDGGDVVQFVTFRLADSMPSNKLLFWKQELEGKRVSDEEYCQKIESWLDAGHGSCWLRNPQIAEVVQNALRFFDGDRYELHGWVVMPNHVHVLVRLHESASLHKVVHSWKSFTAKAANSVLKRTGTFWQDDYFDRYVRDERDYGDRLEYIGENPVQAGLCKICTDWPWSHMGYLKRIGG